ncbi:hypothetical protein BCR42DRAFT_392501 [Absidia repens]|uniref:Uncharacterized protein n=1 Tax=Absidia repens TaxID=90262 RepID=A0A1X2IHI4_9FUNG|nr:hypothetical protein BCR42DRAFT_392501 [Absidia repens]
MTSRSNSRKTAVVSCCLVRRDTISRVSSHLPLSPKMDPLSRMFCLRSPKKEVYQKFFSLHLVSLCRASPSMPPVKRVRYLQLVSFIQTSITYLKRIPFAQCSSSTVVCSYEVSVLHFQDPCLGSGSPIPTDTKLYSKVHLLVHCCSWNIPVII